MTCQPTLPGAYRWQFDHLNLHAAADAPLQRLFGDIMGLTRGYRPPFPFAGDWLYRDGEAWLHLVSARPQPGQGVRLGHIAFRTDEPADSLLARVRDAGLEHEVAFVPEGNCVQIFVRLPGGLVIELDAGAGAGLPRDEAYASRLALAQSTE
ncbi:hypothetical protein DFR29_11091 [Tahibacter aquaticus]|uniref:VOC domain-containing protein n=1 Tax=Tahibacter aquaticus TaxID=520092 RepID=A0A4R6YTE6_9GAMM|nr:hypothetical protein [Tahibacter aquaticus]TDR41608.1 hypothetical protein DFR29_11091 [Tahibacter aquaticus]